MIPGSVIAVAKGGRLLHMHMTSVMDVGVGRRVVDHLRVSMFAAVRLVLGGQLGVLLVSVSVAERRDGRLLLVVAVSIVGSAVCETGGVSGGAGDAGFLGVAVVVVMLLLLCDDGASA